MGGGTYLSSLQDYNDLRGSRATSAFDVPHRLSLATIYDVPLSGLILGGWQFGAIVTEQVFQWHGMGYLFVNAVRNIDFNVMLAWLIVTATIVILFNLVADILYGILDPRIRHA